MNDLRTVAQQALKALAGYRRHIGDTQPCDAEIALLDALAQERVEPVEPVEPVATLTAQRDALLEALKEIAENSDDVGAIDCARDAIAKATGEQA